MQCVRGRLRRMLVVFTVTVPCSAAIRVHAANTQCCTQVLAAPQAHATQRAKTDDCGGLVGNHNQRIPAAQTVKHSAKKTKAATDLGVRDRRIGMQAVAVTHQSKEKHRTCRAPKSNQCYTCSYEAQKAHAHSDSSPQPPPPDKPTNDRERRPDSIYDSKTRPRCPARGCRCRAPTITVTVRFIRPLALHLHSAATPHYNSRTSPRGTSTTLHTVCMPRPVMV